MLEPPPPVHHWVVDPSAKRPAPSSQVEGDASGSDEGFLPDVLLSFQRALWDMVTPELRGVAVSPERPVIEARFLYERPPTEDEIQIVAEVETYVVSDFGLDVDVSFRAVEVPTSLPRDLEVGERWVYLRREVDDARS